jgi:hypothetical protein
MKIIAKAAILSKEYTAATDYYLVPHLEKLGLLKNPIFYQTPL